MNEPSSVSKISELWAKKPIKVIAIVLVSCFVLLLIAAASSGSNDTTDESSPDETTTKEIKEIETISFETVYEETDQLDKDVEQVTVAGVDGEVTILYSVTLDSDGEEISREKISEEVTKEPINEIVAVGTYVYVAPSPAPAAAPAATSSATSASSSTSGSADVYYANCTQARNAGAAPIYRGEPGYRSALDRDNDGIACE